jgi:hypothetical protein
MRILLVMIVCLCAASTAPAQCACSGPATCSCSAGTCTCPNCVTPVASTVVRRVTPDGTIVVYQGHCWSWSVAADDWIYLRPAAYDVHPQQVYYSRSASVLGKRAACTSGTCGR